MECEDFILIVKVNNLDQAWHLIDFQASLFEWGLGIITFIFGLAVLIQWGLNHKKLTDLKTEITNEYTSKIINLEKTIDQLKKDIKNLNEKNNEYENKIINLTSSYTKLNSEYKNMAENIMFLNMKTSNQYQINFMSNPEIAEKSKANLQNLLKKFGYQIDSELYNTKLESPGSNYINKKQFDIRVSFIGIRRNDSNIESNIKLIVRTTINDAISIKVTKFKDSGL